MLPIILLGLGILSKKARDRAREYHSEKVIDDILSKVEVKIKPKKVKV